jgi:uncharacterized protein (DUF427 family)
MQLLGSVEMKIPGPDHPITIEPNLKRVVVKFAGKVVADSTHALTLREASYAPVQYIPRADVDMSLLVRTQSSTHCPYKGDASYYSLATTEQRVDNAVWTYETPFAAMSAIKELLAFYPSRVDSIEEV